MATVDNGSLLIEADAIAQPVMPQMQDKLAFALELHPAVQRAPADGAAWGRG
jgi:hypothetical protein